jgi:hypothetical protein
MRKLCRNAWKGFGTDLLTPRSMDPFLVRCANPALTCIYQQNEKFILTSAMRYVGPTQGRVEWHSGCSSGARSMDTSSLF